MSSKLLERERYLNKLISFKDKPLIKIITGIRRCGKSTLMKMFVDHLLDTGVKPENILYMKFDGPDYLEIDDYFKLLEEVKSKISLSEGNYLLFDEVQDIKGWERAINAMYTAGADVYVTGSNAHMLSSEYSTYISGRYVKIKMYPLTFREYIEFGEGRKEDLAGALDRYKIYGGFPAVALLDQDIKENSEMILSGIYDSVFMNDVIDRNDIRDSATIQNIFKFLMKNIGNQTSVRSISNYIISKGGKTHPTTVDNYIHYLESAYLINRAKRYDVKTKDYLRTVDKFYAVDLGMRNNMVGFNKGDQSGLLENLVYLELLARGKDVAVGAVEGKEIDFIVLEKESKHYYQVTSNMFMEETVEREVRSLLMTGDNYPKTIITDTTDYPFKNIEGIRVISTIDFLLEKYD